MTALHIVRRVDLMPLSSLPELQSLCLRRGDFSSLSAAEHLTTLSIIDCDVVTERCNCVETLVSLKVCRSRITGFDPSGLSACKSLLSLDIADCDIVATHGLNDLDISPRGVVIPESMPNLSSISKLCMEVSVMGGPGETLAMDWLYQFTSLESLQLDITFNFKLDERLHLLSRLSHVSFESCRNAPLTHMQFEFDWGAMSALRSIEVYGHFECDLEILNLLKLDCLTSVIFDGHPVDFESASVFGIFLYRLAGLRPDVCCKIAQADNLLNDGLGTWFGSYHES